MPGLGVTDPADLEAQAHAELGISRRLEQPRRISPYPGFGGSGGYPVVAAHGHGTEERARRELASAAADHDPG